MSSRRHRSSDNSGPQDLRTVNLRLQRTQAVDILTCLLPLFELRYVVVYTFVLMFPSHLSARIDGFISFQVGSLQKRI